MLLCIKSNLEDLILVRLKAVKFELKVPQIPKSHSLVCTSRGKDELGVGVEAEAVHLESRKIEFLNFFVLLSVVAAL